MSEPEVLTEVPLDLKLLVRIIMRSFYGDEHAIVMDKLIHHPCIKEDDLLEMLRFERKQLRAIVTTLKNEKFVRVRMRMVMESEGTGQRAIRHNYYFISYSVLVNVIKYKLDHMRRKIEIDERDATSRASFSCPDCQKKYTDLEVDQLYDAYSGKLLCSYCQTEVVEEAVTKPGGSDSRSLMVMFNEQIEPIFNLLKKVEDIRLSNDILEPEPLERINRSGGSRGANASGSWTNDSSRNVSFGFSENRVTVSVDGRSSAGVNTRPNKQVPAWIAQSTVDGADITDSQPGPSRLSSVVADTNHDVDANDIMRTLLSHEKPAAAAAAAGDSSSSDSDEEQQQQPPLPWHSITTTDVETMDSEGDDDSEDLFTVSVGDVKFAVHQVPEEFIARMTPTEKQQYIKLAQQYHEQFVMD